MPLRKSLLLVLNVEVPLSVWPGFIESSCDVFVLAGEELAVTVAFLLQELARSDGGSYHQMLGYALTASGGPSVMIGVPQVNVRVALLEFFNVKLADVADQMQCDEDGNFIESKYVPPMSPVDPMYFDFDGSGMTLKVSAKYDLDVSKAE